MHPQYVAPMFRRCRLILSQPATALAVVMLPLGLSAASLPTVSTERQPVTNSYHTMVVADDYQWMEEAASPKVREWMRLQNERTRSYFLHLQYRDGIAQQLFQLRSEESARYFGLQEA